MALTTQERLALLAVVDSVSEIPAPPPPPPPPAPPPSGPVLYFSAEAHASNANAGTIEAPKRDLSGLNINALAAGTSLLFRRGDAFSVSNVRLRNLNLTETNPLVFSAYGEGEKPLLQFNDGNGFEFGMNFGDTTVHGYYVFRNLVVRGTDTTTGFGFWCKKNIHHVLIEHCTITNWHVGINGQGGDNSSYIIAQHNSIFNNRAMGWLGEFYYSVFDNNDFSGPGLPSHHFVHLGYLRDGSNIRVTNNKVISTGPAQGGTLTCHGLIDGLVIEGNEFRYGAGSSPGAWVVSLIPDSGTAQGGFLNLVVRNNIIENGGNNGYHIEASPGALIEGNVSILTAPGYQTAIAYADDPGRPQDLKGGGISRHNRAYGPPGSTFGFTAPAGSTELDNLAVIT
jgi:hypothetical protein